MITSWFSLVINIKLNYSLISIGNTFNSRSLYEDLTKLFTISILNTYESHKERYKYNKFQTMKWLIENYGLHL